MQILPKPSFMNDVNKSYPQTVTDYYFELWCVVFAFRYSLRLACNLPCLFMTSTTELSADDGFWLMSAAVECHPRIPFNLQQSHYQGIETKLYLMN